MSDHESQKQLKRVFQSALAGSRAIARIELESILPLCRDQADAWILQAWLSDSPQAFAEALDRALSIESDNDVAKAGQIWGQKFCLLAESLASGQPAAECSADAQGTETQSCEDHTSRVEFDDSPEPSTVRNEDVDRCVADSDSQSESSVFQAQEAANDNLIADQEHFLNECCDAHLVHDHKDHEAPSETSPQQTAQVPENDSADIQTMQGWFSDALAEQKVVAPKASDADAEETDDFENQVTVEPGSEDSLPQLAEEQCKADVLADCKSDEIDSDRDRDVSADTPELSEASDSSVDESWFVLDETTEPVSSAQETQSEANDVSKSETMDVEIEAELLDTLQSIGESAALATESDESKSDASPDEVSEGCETVEDVEQAIQENESTDLTEADATRVPAEGIERQDSCGIESNEKCISVDSESPREASSDEETTRDEPASGLQPCDVANERNEPSASNCEVLETESSTVELRESLVESAEDSKEFSAATHPSEADASEENDHEEEAALRPLILAVDDSPTVRKLVAMTLERVGYEVVSAADGVAALNLLAERLPVMILSDINMPRITGYKLCKLVKKHRRTQHIPVVMLSGKNGVFDKVRGQMVGCTDYITKPFESHDLINKVRQYALASPEVVEAIS